MVTLLLIFCIELTAGLPIVSFAALLLLQKWRESVDSYAITNLTCLDLKLVYDWLFH